MRPAESKILSSSPSILWNVILPAPQPAVSVVQVVSLLLSNVFESHLSVYLQAKSAAGVMPEKETTAAPIGAVYLELAASFGLMKKVG